MYLIYTILFAIGLLLFLPHFLYQALRHGKYMTGLAQRFGAVPRVAAGRPVVWLHCVSVGEVIAARPFARELLRQHPAHELIVSTTTITGQTIAREIFGDLAEHIFYFPLDFKWTMRRALDRLRPAAVILMETEIWPQLVRECARREIPVAIINGRISPTSFKRYRTVRFFFARVLRQVSLASMQTEADAERLRQLGAAKSAVRVSGNIKFDAEPPTTNALELTAHFRRRFNLSGGAGDRPLIIAASTHHPEDKIILDAFRLTGERIDHRKPRLLIAPRHPERFAEVARQIGDDGFTFASRSAAPAKDDATADVILLDSVGELRALYPLSPIVFVGGSIAEKGGHNILEPAAEGCSIITGAHTANFASIVKMFLAAEALIQLPPAATAQQLAACFSKLLGNEELRAGYGKRGRELIALHRGASRRTLELLGPLLDEKALPANEAARRQ